MADEVAAPHEIVIVRRRGGNEDEGHHGGAWKIAFADLMTAMMTFFLVMWLLNVSDKQKITRIASYFNPTVLGDSLPSEKGVHDIDKAESPRGADPELTIKPEETAKSDPVAKLEKSLGDGIERDGDPKKAEEELFNDPFGVLAKMAMRAVVKGDLANGGTRDGSEAMPGGDAFRNPFDPDSIENPMTPPPGALPPRPALRDAVKDAQPPPTPAASPPASAAPGQVLAATDKAAEEREEAQKLEQELLQSISVVAPERTPNVEVKRVDEGILISLSDDFRFGMFSVASAEPKPEVVVVMEKVAQSLAGRPGQIVVRGHTDGRPFKSGKNENWRLSMARAQIAYYMLVRGGLEEARVERIEGYADRQLKIAGDPLAAQNRRIEILLKAAKS